MLVVSLIDTIDEDALVAPVKEGLGIEALSLVIINFVSDISKSMMRW